MLTARVTRGLRRAPHVVVRCVAGYDTDVIVVAIVVVVGSVDVTVFTAVVVARTSERLDPTWRRFNGKRYDTVGQAGKLSQHLQPPTPRDVRATRSVGRFVLIHQAVGNVIMCVCFVLIQQAVSDIVESDCFATRRVSATR